MQKDFITATPDSGGSGSTTVTAAASANQTESARSVNLSVAGGGMTRTVAASQAAGVVTWNLIILEKLYELERLLYQQRLSRS